MPKRKSVAVEDEVPRRRSLRNATSSAGTGAAIQPQKSEKIHKTPIKKSAPKKVAPKPAQKPKEEESVSSEPDSEPPVKKSRTSRQPPKIEAPAAKPSKKSQAKQKDTSPVAQDTDVDASSEKTYWLLKAEPESRFENGVDVKFSIDDLAARTKPEPWDGIRAYAARNNLRAMKKGDLAFFYHSSCKEPGIVGSMEIVQEHSPDLSAHDPKAAYYDASSKPSDPKWSVVHVEFRSKFAVPITLKELRAMGGRGKPLENMQMLKQSRLSVSKVSAAEWEYLMGVAKEKATES